MPLDQGDVTKMNEPCTDCGAEIEIPEDFDIGEIIECPDCGLDFVLAEVDGQICLKELAIEGEDWGE